MYGYCTECDTLTPTAIFSNTLCAKHVEIAYQAVLDSATSEDWEAAYARMGRA